MATKKLNTFIDMDLEWLELQAQEMKDYCDKMKISTLRDRVTGGKVTATVEQQITSKRNTLKDYIEIISAIDKIREKESVKKTSIRGDQELTPFESGEL